MSHRLQTHIKLLIAAVFAAALGSALTARQVAPPVLAQTRPSDYKNFESPQIHPVAITPDGARLLVVNSPGGSLSVFDLSGAFPRLEAEIPVGLEPVSVAARNDREAWVTNWLSDSVSVVDLSAGNVVRTIEVGDEPTDVVLAGGDRETAFVCVSGTAQVKAYDPDAPSAPLHTVEVRGKQPRALARDAQGSRVFVSVFESGNQTTIVSDSRVKEAGGPPKPSVKMAKRLPKAPDAGLIVKWGSNGWADERGDNKWNSAVPYTLSDVDLVVIDVSGPTPQVSREVRGVGTHISNAAFDPSSDRLYVANTESFNHIRFERKLKGRFQSNRVSIVKLDADDRGVTSVDLNPHIDRSRPEGSDAERAASLAMPADIARASDGTLYVAATGSAKVGVLDAGGAVRDRISVGQGPTGLALDEARRRLYVLNRFDLSLSVIDTTRRSEVARISAGFNPEPQGVRRGRLFLYDAGLSAHGDVSCASCHFNGHRDGLAWDLGDPKGRMERVGGLFSSNFHPMKGPMTTQSLRGIIGNEPLHWRGDRAKLADFNPAFVSLLGGTRQLTAEEMADFEAFVLTLTYPPNPFQNLDRTFPDPPSGPSAARGQRLFNDSRLDAAVLTCDQCHTTGSNFRSGTNNVIIPGLLLQEPQDFKVPQLRGLYQKVGMRKAPGEQAVGFGFIHDGSIDTLLSFLRLPVFTFRNDDDRRDVEAFLMAFDSGIAPAVGLQVTAGGDNKLSTAVTKRLSLLAGQADAANCDLIVKGVFAGERRGFLYVGNGMFQSDRGADSQLSLQELLQAAGAGAELTFTGVPVGSGRRLAVDRDADGTLDADE
jgi:YVTN family beta-propeller protein